MPSLRNVLVGLASIGSALAAGSYPSLKVRNAGVPVGQLKNVSGIQIYHSYPPGRNTSAKAILFVTDIYGVPLLQNQLLADSLASNDYLVIMPDLFAGDAVSVEEQEAGLNLTEWRALHPTPEIDRIINTTIGYMRSKLDVEKIGGVGYCFGGKYVPRFLKASGGIDAGFIAHPSALTEGEISAIKAPVSIAAGTLDAAFNATAKSRAETILNSNNVTFQSNLYFAAPHGFAVRVNQSIPQQAYAKQASFVQAVTWFDSWL
ncbi:alpha/beta-hydrolase [Cucurbitaria berberidis CBS 394.84]|uniref:Alpha/beta-hydrolase n=1 Tax=Cucurbitaria berberidis CBS 394.84 TaxID=1168544 RepID=A0A9P4L8B8_9PLEO|nr:alpha/beta-hydrolase [Cucurbitaria berberidis CBS 394.84]KAF1845916.1 alpha/beta-hydrolase [Cucurbitaria berberidis CBS 394.84]